MKSPYDFTRITLRSITLALSLALAQNMAAVYEGGRVIHRIYVNQSFYGSDGCDGFWQFRQGTAANGTYVFTIPFQGTYFVTCTNGLCNPDTVQYASAPNEDLSNGRTFEIVVNGRSYTSTFTSTNVQYVDHGPGKTVRPPPVDVFIDGATPNTKCNDDKVGGNQDCGNCDGMARYSVHSMLASLNIQDTPLRYTPPVGPTIEFTVTYNQKESQQPSTFSYSNLGPKWTFNWLSYVTVNPAAPLSTTVVYLPGGGAEIYSFDSDAQSFGRDPQSHALLVRTGSNSYERRLPDGSVQMFNLSDGAATYPRKLFMTRVVDPMGNRTSIEYDSGFRVIRISDATGLATTISYGLGNDPRKITRVTDPFGRFATFDYENNKLKTITDEIGMQSLFTYHSGTDAIATLTTPYGITQFASGESGQGNAISRWIEITDPIGGKERVEYRDQTPGMSPSDAVAPSAAGIVNDALNVANTFYWDKKAMAVAPGDYARASIKHWLLNINGAVSGIVSSEKRPLESRIWYTYQDQPHYRHIGSSAQAVQMARLLSDGSTQLWRYEYNSLGHTTKATDPVGRVTRYIYDLNQIDLLEVRQMTGVTNALIRKFTYDLRHRRITETDAAGQTTTYTYNSSGQILTRTNAKGEQTTCVYGDGGSVPAGHLASISSQPFDGVSAVTRFGYDAFHRIRTVTNEADQSTVTTDYDNLDRKTVVTHPDGTYEQFTYTDNITGKMTLDLTGSRDRGGHWTYRHYDSNRKMDSITDAMGQTTLFSWCNCGSLTSITDPNGNRTAFDRDLQSRVYRKNFPDGTTVEYLFEGQAAPDSVGATSRLRSSTDALGRRTTYSYFADNNISSVSYTDSAGNPLEPPTPPVSYTYDPSFNRLTAMIDGTGTTVYTYYPVDEPPAVGAGMMLSIDGPLTNDTVTFTYDELGRTIGQSVNRVVETVAYDSLGRLTTTDNRLGHFSHSYEGVTSRLKTTAFPNGQKTRYNYFGNEQDRRLRSIQNSVSNETEKLSQFDYAHDRTGQIIEWDRELQGVRSGLWFKYDDLQQLVSASNAEHPEAVTRRLDYDYDAAGNRVGDSDRNPQGTFPNTGTFRSYLPNALNQIGSYSTQSNGTNFGNVELQYDPAGNLIDDGERTEFEWDAANRLIAINYPNNSRSEFTYDGLSRRVQIVEKSDVAVVSTKRFVWIGNRLAEERDANDAVTRRFFEEGEERTGTPGGQLYFYSRDHLGSIREVTNDGGKLMARYDYDPFGRRTRLEGFLDLDFGYAGHYCHAQSGLDLTLYRAYNPTLGRWLSRDPLGEKAGMNLYQHVQNDPIGRVDPLGLFDFRYYGNWGGPGWTGGQWRPYEDLTPQERGNLVPPIDAQDHCYMLHDICYSRCRTKTGCTADGNPRKIQMRQENKCEAICDYDLASCLAGLHRQNLHSRIGRTVFAWRYVIR